MRPGTQNGPRGSQRASFGDFCKHFWKVSEKSHFDTFWGGGGQGTQEAPGVPPGVPPGAPRRAPGGTPCKTPPGAPNRPRKKGPRSLQEAQNAQEAHNTVNMHKNRVHTLKCAPKQTPKCGGNAVNTHQFCFRSFAKAARSHFGMPAKEPEIMPKHRKYAWNPSKSHHNFRSS